METKKPTPRELRRVAIASCAGTTIEYYDFFIYGTAAALVFPQVFFPALGTAAATVASFATFAVAFLARPLGAIFFGHFGDKLGRKKTLVSTLLLMGVATVLMGAVPDSATIGIVAPVALIVLRVAQGLALGGEWAGATLLAAEYAPKEKRGLYGVFPQLGPALGLLLSSGSYLLTITFMGNSNAMFLSYGWRVPFLASIVLVVVGLYVRLKVEETPAFKAAQAEVKNSNTPSRPPLFEVLRYQPREVLLAGGAMTMLFAFFYIGTAYLTSYGTSPEGAALTRPVVLGITMAASVVFGIATVVSGALSDRFGRRKIIVFSCLVGMAWGLALFPILGTGNALMFAVGQTFTMVLFAVAYGPAGSFLPELFSPRHRYTGAGLGYNLAGVLGGGLAPVLAPGLAASFGGIGIGIMLSLCGLLSLVCTLALRETRGVTMAHERATEIPQDAVS